MVVAYSSYLRFSMSEIGTNGLIDDLLQSNSFQQSREQFTDLSRRIL